MTMLEERPDFPVRIGGLYRCCVETGHSTSPDEVDNLSGHLPSVQCPHCKEWLVWRNGAWEWDQQSA